MADADLITGALKSKLCTSCQCVKEHSEYYRDKKTKDGLYCRCKKCHLISTSKWGKENKDVVALGARTRRLKNPEKQRAYQRKFQSAAYVANPEKFREISKKNRAKNPEGTNASSAASRAKKPEQAVQYMADYYEKNKIAIKEGVKLRSERLKVELRPGNSERVMRRNARKLQASPAWANQKIILEIYKQAAYLTSVSGVKHQVDHVVPLQSKKVCGLHVEHNLQILTAKENQEKSNRWDWSSR